jgi:hypothetical protein
VPLLIPVKPPLWFWLVMFMSLIGVAVGVGVGVESARMVIAMANVARQIATVRSL